LASLASPDFSAEDLQTVLGRELLVTPTPRALDVVIENVTALIGAEATKFLIHGLTTRDASGPAEALRGASGADPAQADTAADLVGRFRRLFGHRARELVDYWGDNERDWRAIEPNLYRDITDTWVARLELRHYDGNSSLIEGPPKSLLMLVTLVLGVLARVPSKDAFPEPDLARLREAVGFFEGALAGQSIGEQEQQPDQPR
jgi:hypothetical protein